MASGAFISSKTAFQKPSVFSLIAAEGLASSARPAFEHLAWFLSSKNPERWGWLFNYSDEIYLNLNLLLQLHSLRCSSATFAEQFYGLVRRGKYIKLWTVLTEVLVPYVKIKLNKYHETLTARQNLTSGENWFRTLYPLFNFSAEIGSTLMVLGYVLNIVSKHSFGTWISNIRIADHDEFTSAKPGLSSALSYVLEISAFFLQFLHWWYASFLNKNLIISINSSLLTGMVTMAHAIIQTLVGQYRPHLGLRTHHLQIGAPCVEAKERTTLCFLRVVTSSATSVS